MNITAVRHSIRNWGADKVFLNYLAHLAEQGHEVTYWTNRRMTCFPISPKITIKKIPFPGILGTIFFTLTSKLPSDVILVDLVVMALLGNFRNKNKILYLAQDDDLTYYRSGLLRAIVNFAYKQVLRAPGIKVVTVSASLAQKLQRYNPLGLMVLDNGIDLSFFQKNVRSAFFPQRTKPNVILFFARPDRRKGLDIALDCFVHLKNFLPPETWEIWAIGPEQVTLEGMTIKNFGFLRKEEELRDILSAADVFLIPSRSEGLSLLLLQALGCGCAVVTTTASGIITHETNGLVSPIEDSHALAQNLKRVLTEPGLLERLKTAGRGLAEKYDIRESQKMFEKIINDHVHAHARNSHRT